MRARTVLEGVGAALLLFPSYLLLLLPSNLALYHHRLPMTNLIGATLIDLVGASILAASALVAIDHLPQSLQRMLLPPFAGFMLWRTMDVLFLIWGDISASGPGLQFYSWEQARRKICIAIILLLMASALWLPCITASGIRAIRLIIAAYGFSACWVYPQLLHLVLAKQTTEDPAFTYHPLPAQGASKERIVWILFDELSYDETFDHPAPDTHLPNFDRLRSASISFSNLEPAGFYTDRIIPSLFLGRRIDQIRSTADGQLWYKDDSLHRWTAFDPAATVFATAQQTGWNPGIDGWFNPYCRLLAPVLTACSWSSDGILSIERHGASEDKSMLANAAVLPSLLLDILRGHANVGTEGRIENYRAVMADATGLIENGQIRFVFLHLPIPHPPGIYDRNRRVVQAGGSYLDNLALADSALGELLSEIDHAPDANQTTVIVSSDHSWRVPIWRAVPGWTSEEERVSQGKFDPRPVLLIHFPGQSSGSQITAPVPELIEHHIISAMLRHQVTSLQDLNAFLLSSAQEQAHSGQYLPPPLQ